MDDFTSLIPLQQDYDPELYSPTIPSFPYLDHTNIHNIHQDLGNQGDSSLASHQENQVAINNNTDGRRQPKSSTVRDVNNNQNPDDNKQKKAVHRAIERQRRQEMANLYASLRTLLPLEYIKGKRSTSDHVHEAVNYIKDMEKNIRELEVKRDNLRNLLDGSDLEVKNVEASTFTVRSCSGGGIEIMMKIDLTDNWFPLSRILELLLDEGLTVVSCVCTKVDQKFLYAIQTEASDMTKVDLCLLLEKLNDKVITSKNLESTNINI